MPAAAGGPKGLALLPFDRLFAREWLPRVRSMELVGASIGAWRMASLAQDDPVAALDRLQHAYVREQNYDERPSPSQVASVCRGLARSVFGAPDLALRPGVALSVITARARGALAGDRSKLAFGRVALVNAASRRWLANHMERVVFHAGAPSKLPPAFDAFGLTQIALTRDNIEDALLASGSIPLVCDPVRDVLAAPPGDYWDGGLIDYHLLLPYEPLRRHRAVSALRSVRDARVARQVPAVAQAAATPPLARERRPDRAVARHARSPAEPQAARPQRLLQVRTGSRRAHRRVGTRDRRVGTVRRSRAAWLTAPDTSLARAL